MRWQSKSNDSLVTTLCVFTHEWTLTVQRSTLTVGRGVPRQKRGNKSGDPCSLYFSCRR